MAIEFTAILITIVIVAILILVKIKKLKHEVVAMFLIALLLFGVFSFAAVFKGKDITINNVSDLEKVVTIYFNWLGFMFNNVKVITTNAIHMDWKGNQTT